MKTFQIKLPLVQPLHPPR